MIYYVKLQADFYRYIAEASTFDSFDSGFSSSDEESVNDMNPKQRAIQRAEKRYVKARALDKYRINDIIT